MGKIEIYSSKKKSISLFVVSLLFVVCGIYIFMYAEDFTGFTVKNIVFIKTIAVLAVVFFGLGLYVSARQLFSDQLLVVIDRKGINANPKKSLTEFIPWQHIKGFSELKLHNQNFIIIDVDNPDYWIQREENKIQKKMMEFNASNCGSPFSLSANSMKMSNTELLQTLNENFNKYKNNA